MCVSIRREFVRKFPKKHINMSRRHDSPLIVTKKKVAHQPFPKQNEELYSNALLLTMIRNTEDIRREERALRRIPSTSSESKADVHGSQKSSQKSLESRMMFERHFLETIARGALNVSQLE